MYIFAWKQKWKQLNCNWKTDFLKYKNKNNINNIIFVINGSGSVL